MFISIMVSCPLLLEMGHVLISSVGGEILDLAIGRMKPYGRIVCCGAIAAYK